MEKLAKLGFENLTRDSSMKFDKLRFEVKKNKTFVGIDNNMCLVPIPEDVEKLPPAGTQCMFSHQDQTHEDLPPGHFMWYSIMVFTKKGEKKPTALILNMGQIDDFGTDITKTPLTKH